MQDYSKYRKGNSSVYARFGSSAARRRKKVAVNTVSKTVRTAAASTTRKPRKKSAAVRRDRRQMRNLPDFNRPSFKRAFRIALTLSAIAALAVVGFFCVTSMRESDAFSVRRIEISGEQRLSKEEIARVAAIPAGANLLAIDMAAIAEQVEKHPWVARVTVSRSLPDALFIKLEERSPAMLVNADLDGGGSRLYLVDDHAVLFKLKESGDPADLPIVTGLTRKDFAEAADLKPQQMQDALRLIAMAREKGLDGGNLSEIMVLRNGLLKAVFEQPNLEVRLDASDMPRQIERLAQVMNLGLNGVVALDLAYSDRAVVRLATPERQQKL